MWPRGEYRVTPWRIFAQKPYPNLNLSPTTYPTQPNSLPSDLGIDSEGFIKPTTYRSSACSGRYDDDIDLNQ